MKTSRLLGALIGFVIGAGIGVGITFYLYGSDMEVVGWGARLLAGLVVGAIGALLGSLSGMSGV
jgi:hypothetical protein